jgi:hypothetical protein
MKRSSAVAMALALAVASGARAARASSVNVRCERVAEPARGELQARARLLLLGAGLHDARVFVDCDAAGAWLVWVDGGKTRIDETSGIVEGVLDAIENRLHPSTAAAPPAIPAPQAPVLAAPPKPKVDPPSPSASRSAVMDDDSVEGPTKRSADTSFEGGISLASRMEIWPGSVLLGPDLEVGLGIGKKFAFVIGEGGRFGVGRGDAGHVIVFDLEAGLSYGAPYQVRTGFGAVLLAGAERIAISNDNLSGGGAWAWSALAILGLRASASLGSFDGWIGVDGLVRSTTFETGDPGGLAVPSATAMLSLGFFLPAITTGPVPPPSASATSSAGPSAWTSPLR